MKPRPRPQDSGTQELFRAKLKNIINLGHELVRLGELIDWERLEMLFAPYYREAGRPGLPIRLVVGLHLLKHIEGLSDEAVCERWERDPYMQYFCGEEYFQHAFPLERSGMTHFRKRVGEEALETLLQETLAAAHRGGALSVRDGDRTVGPASEKSGAALAAIVCARGAACGDEDGALSARAAEETRQATSKISACALAATDSRRAPQDGGAARSGRIVRRATRTHAGARLAYGAATARR